LKIFFGISFGEFVLKVKERLENIVSYIETHGFASVNQLSHLFEVSEMTIRRDLDKLSEQKRVLRTYGGGAPIPSIKNKLSSESSSDENADVSSFLFCESDVLITTSLNPKYDPILFGSGGKPKFPIVAESVPHKNSISCVGIDNYAAGYLLGNWAGEYAIKHFARKAGVLDLGYPFPNTEERSRGFLKGLADIIPEISSVTSLNAQSNFDIAYQLTCDALVVNDDINIIFAINDTHAWGAIQACEFLQIDPNDIIVISFGLEGDTIKNALYENNYCKVTLAMFPEIVGQTCIDTAVLAYHGVKIPQNIQTPYALLTKESLIDFYKQTKTGWELNWDQVNHRLEMPSIRNQVNPQTISPIPDCIGILVPFAEHEWYQNMITAMQSYATKLNINIEILDAEQNLKDELELRKREIARRAAQEIQPGDVIFIDGGIVAQYLVEMISKNTDITVITNATNVFDSLKNNPAITLISTGGVLRRNNHSLVGPTAEGSLRDMRVDKLFLTVSGVSIDFGLSHTNLSEVSIKQAMIKCAREVILLADHSKFNQESLIQIAPISVVDVLITDNGLPAGSRLQLNAAGVDVIITET
jgi:DeoR/GlpR family transcriptional regulator of sugar metabolism